MVSSIRASIQSIGDIICNACPHCLKCATLIGNCSRSGRCPPGERIPSPRHCWIWHGVTIVPIEDSGAAVCERTALGVEIYRVLVDLPDCVQVDRPICHCRQVAHSLLVVIDLAASGRCRPALVRVACAAERVFCQLLPNAVGEGLVGHRARAAVRVESDLVFVGFPEGRECLVPSRTPCYFFRLPSLERVSCGGPVWGRVFIFNRILVRGGR